MAIKSTTSAATAMTLSVRNHTVRVLTERGSETALSMTFAD